MTLIRFLMITLINLPHILLISLFISIFWSRYPYLFGRGILNGVILNFENKNSELQIKTGFEPNSLTCEFNPHPVMSYFSRIWDGPSRALARYIHVFGPLSDALFVFECFWTETKPRPSFIWRQWPTESASGLWRSRTTML